jgi:uncharacterized protein
MTMTTSSTGGYRNRMKLTLDAQPQFNLIRSYSAEEVRVGNHVLRRSAIVTPDTVIAGWRPASVEDLALNDLEPLFAAQPQLVLLGTGGTHRFAHVSIRGAFAERGISLETMNLGAACRTFNILVQDERRVCAALLFGPQSE